MSLQVRLQEGKRHDELRSATENVDQNGRIKTSPRGNRLPRGLRSNAAEGTASRKYPMDFLAWAVDPFVLVGHWLYRTFKMVSEAGHFWPNRRNSTPDVSTHRPVSLGSLGRGADGLDSPNNSGLLEVLLTLFKFGLQLFDCVDTQIVLLGCGDPLLKFSNWPLTALMVSRSVASWARPTWGS